jgi:hypothetical protein
MTISENALFDVSVSIVDKFTKKQIPNISWNNYTWIAKAQLHSLGYYPANGSLVLTNSSAFFDASTGLATFKNLAITLKGMYCKFTLEFFKTLI